MLRIIAQDLWNMAAARLQTLAELPASQAIRASQFWLKRRPRHLLSGLVNCGHCGARMIAVGKDYLRCGSADRNAGCSNNKLVRRSLLEALIVDSLRNKLLAPELVSEFINEVHQELKRQRKQSQIDQTEIANRLRKIDDQLDSLVTAIAEGLRAASPQSRLNALEAEKEALPSNCVSRTPK
jgi:site-specific DNA recombinase